jgi:hypothetical protein
MLVMYSILMRKFADAERCRDTEQLNAINVEMFTGPNERLILICARFGWDMIRLTDTEMDPLVDHADAGMFDEAEAVVDEAEKRLFHEA